MLGHASLLSRAHASAGGRAAGLHGGNGVGPAEARLEAEADRGASRDRSVPGRVPDEDSRAALRYDAIPQIGDLLVAGESPSHCPAIYRYRRGVSDGDLA